MALKKPQGTISLTRLGFSGDEKTKAVSGIIGRKGSGIKRITAPHTSSFVKMYDSKRGMGVRARASECDTLFITATTMDAVKEIGMKIIKNMKAIINDEEVDGPHTDCECPEDALPHIIGAGGNGLRKIQNMVDDNCHIHYNTTKKRFDITADSLTGCKLVVIIIRERIHMYYETIHRKKSSLLEGVPPSKSVGQFYEKGGTENTVKPPESQRATSVSSSDETSVEGGIDKGSHPVEVKKGGSFMEFFDNDIYSKACKNLNDMRDGTIPKDQEWNPWWEMRKKLYQGFKDENDDPRYKPQRYDCPITGGSVHTKGLWTVPEELVDKYMECELETERLTQVDNHVYDQDPNGIYAYSSARPIFYMKKLDLSEDGGEHSLSPYRHRSQSPINSLESYLSPIPQPPPSSPPKVIRKKGRLNLDNIVM